jgi:ABC-type transport system involved in multi-copper enzyme maturation permease subunit
MSHAPTVPVTLGPARVPALKVTQARVLRSEFTKLRSLRSTLWTLLSAVVLMIGIGALFAVVTSSQYHAFIASQRASFNPAGTSLSGITFAQIAFGVLGVLIVSGEYSTGMIRSSLTAVPRRLPVLWGKLAVFAGMIFGVSVIASFISFFIGQAVLSGHHLDVAITAPGALRSVIGAALYVTVVGMIAVGLGTLLRNTAAGISAFVAVFFIIPPLAQALPSSISSHLGPYLPTNAGAALYGGANVNNPLPPWAGFGLLCGYAAVVIGAAAWRLRRTDA